MVSPLPAFSGLVASAREVIPSRKWTPTYDGWQAQLWNFYDAIGEFESAVSWRANTMSRIRLVAAELTDTGDEPIPLTEGPAAEIMARLAGGTAGQAQMMKELTIHLSVPGEGWILGESSGDGDSWQVLSADEIRTNPKNGRFQVREGRAQGAWRTMAEDSTVFRVWRPHPRYGWEPTSDARYAMGAMVELDLINKRIIAELSSRIASNGILLYDKARLSLPSATMETPDGGEAPDPFAVTLVEVAKNAIQDPSSPYATLPLPIGHDLQDAVGVDPRTLIHHLKFNEFLDEKLITQRDSAVKRLATSLDIPSEILLGMGGLNHWSAWQVEESGIKIHISPIAELICHALTVSYLTPYLEASGSTMTGPNGGRVVVWYDPSEITVRPDRTDNVRFAYDRGEVSGAVLRREIGLNEDGDAPSPGDQADWTRKFMARQAATAPAVYAELTGDILAPAGPDDADTTAPGDQDSEDSATDLPETNPGDAPDTGPQSLSDMSTIDLQARLMELSAELDARSSPASAWGFPEDPLRVRTTPVTRGKS